MTGELNSIAGRNLLRAIARSPQGGPLNSRRMRRIGSSWLASRVRWQSARTPITRHRMSDPHPSMYYWVGIASHCREKNEFRFSPLG